MHIWYLMAWWVTELMVCEGDLNKFEIKTNVEYGKLCYNKSGVLVPLPKWVLGDLQRS